MSTKFGKIGIVRVEDDGTWTLVKTDLPDNSKLTAESFIHSALEEYPDQKLQIVRFYPEVFTVEEVVETTRKVTTTSDVRFEEPEEVPQEDLEEVEDDEETRPPSSPRSHTEVA